MRRGVAAGAYAGWFATLLGLAAAGFLSPMDEPPVRLSHLVAYGPAMIEGGLAASMAMLLFDRSPPLWKVTACLWAGSGIYLFAATLDQNVSDAGFRLPMALMGLWHFASLFIPRFRSFMRVAAGTAVLVTVAFATYTHLSLLFPANAWVDAERERVVLAVASSRDPFAQHECDEPHFRCLRVDAGTANPGYPGTDWARVLSYAPHAGRLGRTYAFRTVEPDAPSAPHDFRFYAVRDAPGGGLAVVVSDLRHMMEPRVVANRSVMTSITVAYAIWVGLIYTVGLAHSAMIARRRSPRAPKDPQNPLTSP